jgi:hypothetical protein
MIEILMLASPHFLFEYVYILLAPIEALFLFLNLQHSIQLVQVRKHTQHSDADAVRNV